MQVAQVSDYDTHAVIGGGKAQAFTISDSPEFFTVLSDTLYRDKELAVVREVVCNAWDAHIMVGKTDVPVEILLIKDELVIKDFGPGIAADRIVDIYCSYGTSTKVKDDKQTGGFGLGSKAPFAYSDHFSVTSCHAGVRTVYAISRGGTETGGKPDIRAMVSVPTTESGLTVSIPIKDEISRARFSQLIRRVVRNGGMLARLNGDDLPRIDYSRATQGFMVVPVAMIDAQVSVLYGTVLYPADTTNHDMRKLIGKLQGEIRSEQAIILLAKPGSLAITPSREALSYNERTMAAIDKMLRSTINKLKAAAPIARRRVAEEAIKDLGVFDNPRSIRRGDSVSITGDPVQIKEHVERSSYHYSNALLRAIHKARMRAHPNHRRSLRRQCSRQNGQIEYLRESLRLPLRAARQLGLENTMLAMKHTGYEKFDRGLVPLSKLNGRMGAIHKEVIIAFKRADAIEYVRDEFNASSTCGVLVFLLPNREKLKDLTALLTRFKVDHSVIEPVKRAAPKPKQKKVAPADMRFLALKNVSDGNAAPAPTLKSPKHFIVARRQEGVYLPNAMDAADRQRVEALYGDVAVIFTNEERKVLEDSGAKELFETMRAELAPHLDDKDLQYRVWAPKAFHRERRNYGVLETIQVSIDIDPSLVSLFFPAKIKKSEKLDRLVRLVEVMTAINRFKEKRTNTINFRSELNGLHDKALQSWKQFVMSEHDAEKKFPYLKIVSFGHRHVPRETAGFTVRTLHEHWGKSKLTVKEAA